MRITSRKLLNKGGGFIVAAGRGSVNARDHNQRCVHVRPTQGFIAYIGRFRV
jgi:hypothetical protein